MQQRNEKLFQFGFFFFASFGAASIFASVVVFLLALLFSITGNALSLSSNLWIFLFMFPAALAFSASFIAPKLNVSQEGDILPMVIVGYGTYSVVSLVILLLGGRSEPALWALAVLVLVSLAMFNTDRIFPRFFLRGETARREVDNTQLSFDTSILPMKITDNLKKDASGKKKPIFYIRDSSPHPKEGSASEDESTAVVEEDGDTIIHLGPRI